MADEKKEAKEPVIESKVYPKGKPVNLMDIMAAAETRSAVEYSRCPAFMEGQVFVLQSVTAGDIIEWTEANDGNDKRTAGLRLIVKSVVDGEPGVDEGAQGKLIMDDHSLQMLRKIPHKHTERVIKEIIKLNGMTVKQDKDAKND